MKTLFAAIALFCMTLILTGKTDPFNVQEKLASMSKATSQVVNPEIRYAVASSDKVVFATINIEKPPTDVHRTDRFSVVNFNAEQHQSSLDELCATAPTDMQKSDTYQLYCQP